MSDKPTEEPDESTDYGRYSPECTPSGEDELWGIILDLVEQSCGVKTGDELDSWATGAYERAILALAEAGFVEIDPASGRIYAKLLPKAHKFAEWMEFHDRANRIRAARQELATVPGLTPETTARRYDITVAELTADTPDHPTEVLIEQPAWPKA
jgi:hypothetical protein